MLSHSLYWLKDHPTLSTLIALSALSGILSVVRAKAAPGSKLYHFADMCLGLISDGVSSWNSARAMMGKPPVAIPEKPKLVRPEV